MSDGDDILDETEIDGFHVELLQQDGSVSCHVSINDYEYSSSLTVVEEYGYIENTENGSVYDVPDKTVAMIAAWAESHDEY